MKKTDKRKAIKESLNEQLIEMGADNEHFLDVIDDYMSFWDIKNKLKEDIEARGVSVEWRNSPTSNGFKKNESITELVKVNAQMLKILQQLNINTTDGDPDDDDF